jgi:benzoate-CoA ligase family protein
VTVFNAADFLVHRHVRGGAGDKTALVGSHARTYCQLADDLAQLAAGLRRLGLRRDDRIAIVMADDTEMATTILAAFHGGYVAVPISTMLNDQELGEVLRDCCACVLVATRDFLGSVVPAVNASPDVAHLVLAGRDGDVDSVRALVRDAVTVTRWPDVRGPADAPAGTEADGWALWLYTSGTTGTPKAAMHRHANIRHVYETYGRQTLNVGSDERCLSVAKMFFAYGIGNSLFFPLAAGASSILQPQRPTPKSMGELLNATSPTLFFGVPTFYSSLLASDLGDEAFASVRLCISAGEVLPEIVQLGFTKRFGVDVLDGIGSTEALHIFLSNTADDIRPGTTGKPVPGYTLELRDVNGHLVGPGTPGDLYVRGESIALGYWRRADADRTVFQGDWLRTGDTYVVDELGYYRCLGRSNDLLKAGGIWVSPSEVEERLLEHEAVAEAAVVGLPDSSGIDKPVALVVRASGYDAVSADDLIAWCRSDLASFKRPRSVEFASVLPKTATGKVQRYRVRQMLLDSTKSEALQ